MKLSRRITEILIWILSCYSSIKLLDPFKTSANQLSVILYGLILLSSLGALSTGPWSRFDNSYKFLEIRRVIMVLVFLFNVMFWLIYDGSLFENKPMETFHKAKIEWVITILLILGVIGAFWAVLAKTEAAQALEIGNKLYNSISGTFDFRNILGRDEYMLKYHLERNGLTELTLFLGPPAVGMFMKKRNKFVMYDKAMIFLEELTQKINSFKINRLPQEIKIYLVCFCEQVMQNYLRSLKDIKKKKDYIKIQKKFLEAVNGFETTCPSKFYFKALEHDPGIRFAISKSNDKEEWEKATVWLVAGFEHLHPTEFLSGGFKTRDAEIIKILKKLRDDTMGLKDGKK